MFTRLSRSCDYPGIGMGLAICRRMQAIAAGRLAVITYRIGTACFLMYSSTRAPRPADPGPI
jgi:hypothetical protein